MSDRFEQQLRAALQRVDPEQGFEQRVMARLDSGAGVHPSPRARLPWLITALAASAIFGAVVVHGWQVRQEQQGLEARQHLIDALRVTGEKLDIAYRVVNADRRSTETQDTAPDDSGA